jgi:hypothetical protein
MQPLALALGLPPESVIAPPIPLAAALQRELVTHMVAAIIAVHQAGGPLTDAHPAPSSHNPPLHRQRKAIVYLRQSSERQGQRHTESQRLQ